MMWRKFRGKFYTCSSSVFSVRGDWSGNLAVSDITLEKWEAESSALKSLNYGSASLNPRMPSCHCHLVKPFFFSSTQLQVMSISMLGFYFYFVNLNHL